MGLLFGILGALAALGVGLFVGFSLGTKVMVESFNAVMKGHLDRGELVIGKDPSTWEKP